MNHQLLRQIPKVDELLKMPVLEALLNEMPAQTVTRAVRQALDDLRQSVLEGKIEELPTRDAICAKIAVLACRENAPSLRRVINGTGIILHTNLGRACLSEKAAQAAASVAGSYSNLEFNLATGGRGLRYTHIEELFCRLTGAESALVVNNNAAAVLLVLSARPWTTCARACWRARLKNCPPGMPCVPRLRFWLAGRILPLCAG